MGTPEFVLEVSAIVPHPGEYKTGNYSLRIKRVKRDFFLVATGLLRSALEVIIQISGALWPKKE